MCIRRDLEKVYTRYTVFEVTCENLRYHGNQFSVIKVVLLLSVYPSR